MGNTPAEVIKEYQVYVEGLDFLVKARIIKSVSGDEKHLFIGELSHYCKQDEDAIAPYRPSLIREHFDSVESLIIQYLEKFTTMDVVADNFY